MRTQNMFLILPRDLNLDDANKSLASAVNVLHTVLLNLAYVRAHSCLSFFADIIQWNILQLCILSKDFCT